MIDCPRRGLMGLELFVHGFRLTALRFSIHALQVSFAPSKRMSAEIASVLRSTDQSLLILEFN